MSLYTYTGKLADGKAKSGKVTAKSEKQARERLAAELKVAVIDSIKPQVEPAHPPKPPQKTKSLSKLQKMLYLQHGCCFFCGQELPEKEASIEHLNPKAKGGVSREDNEVVCHASLNHTFGDMGLKQKFEFILRQKGAFKCPA